MLTPVSQDRLNGKLQVAFLSSCLPRKCGIALFSASLSRALENYLGQDAISFIAMNNNERYNYSPRVIFEVEQEKLEDYFQAASILNSSAVDVVSLQHEFGLFGGPDGNYLRVLLKHLKKPVVTTCHTVLQDPSPGQKKTFTEIASYSRELVVMNKLAIELLTNVYDIPLHKIRLIPHGVPEKEYKVPSFYKEQLNLQDRFLIITFGFVSPNKGIENMLNALPAVVRKHPRVLYMVVGATHPVEKKHNGEDYRRKLEAQVKQMGLSRNVLFIDAFVEDETLDCLVGAADLVVCPYYSEAQITSGVLSTALSKGKAIISTPFLHAREALADGCGSLVDAGDATALAKETINLIDNSRKRTAMAKKAYDLGRLMGWNNVSAAYLETFSDVVKPAVAVK